MDDENVTVALHRRRAWLGIGCMALGVVLGISAAWLQWSSRSQQHEAVAQHLPDQEALNSKFGVAPAEDDGRINYEDGPTDMQESMPTLLSYWLVFASFGLLYGGFRVFRSARLKQRVELDPKRTTS